jgi:magnesium chelatase family protein
MLAKLFTYSLFGIDAKSVEVEVDISPASLPKTTLVGLAEAAVKESIPRIERALVNSGYHRPIDRIVINLSPADLPKEAPSSDLPIAIGMLAASGQVCTERFAQYSVATRAARGCWFPRRTPAKQRSSKNSMSSRLAAWLRRSGSLVGNSR